MIKLNLTYIMMMIGFYRYIMCQLTTLLTVLLSHLFIMFVNINTSVIITRHFNLRLTSKKFSYINKKCYSDVARRDTDGAWCMRDLDQTWWQPIHRMLVDNIHKHGGPLGVEVGSGFESLLSQHVVYEDLFVTINGRSSVLSYLNTKRSSMFTVRYYGLEPPIFSPRLVGAERNVFSAEGGHVPNQLRINAMVSCSLWRAVPVMKECRCRIIISFDDNNMVTSYQVTSNEKRGLSKSMKMMLGAHYKSP